MDPPGIGELGLLRQIPWIQISHAARTAFEPWWQPGALPVWRSVALRPALTSGLPVHPVASGINGIDRRYLWAEGKWTYLLRNRNPEYQRIFEAPSMDGRSREPAHRVRIRTGRCRRTRGRAPDGARLRATRAPCRCHGRGCIRRGSPRLLARSRARQPIGGRGLRQQGLSTGNSPGHGQDSYSYGYGTAL